MAPPFRFSFDDEEDRIPETNIQAIPHTPPNQQQGRVDGVTFEDMRRLQDAYNATNLVSSRQRRGRTRRVAVRQSELYIDWADEENWTAPDVTGQPAPIPINRMSDEDLWTTINWVVQNRISLYQAYGNPEISTDKPVAWSAALWLRAQSVFRAMVKEAAERDLSFPETTIGYLREYVLAANRLRATEPWRDPAQSMSKADKQAFKDIDVVLPEAVTETQAGRPHRHLDL